MPSEGAPSVRRRLLRFLLVPLALLLGIGIFIDYRTGAMPIHRAYDQVLREATGLPVAVAEDPLQCVALGTGRALEEMRRLRNVLTSMY